ncbi:MAG: lipoate--protein ligase [Oscillospiraceae bacterium]|nr:lipoate--protein ligase [Oscillospiraceae bacterium]
MKIIISPFTHPSLNLALEEYIFDNFTNGDIVMLWRNERSVIIGKNQNAYAEIDLDFVEKNKIPVVRRITGGGAVFHDLGNINFTFISDYKEGSFGSYTLFAKPICDFLRTLNLTAEVSGRNDITSNGYKISGNAQTVRKNRILQHGTLLYSADLNELSGALKPRHIKLSGKGISSVRSRVENIKTLAACTLSAEEFLNELYGFFLSQAGLEEIYLREEDISAVKSLSTERYETFDWNFGFSPAFSLVKEKRFTFGILEAHLDIRDAKIEGLCIFGDFFGILPISELETALVGTQFTPSAVSERLKDFPLSDYISTMSISDLCDLLF